MYRAHLRQFFLGLAAIACLAVPVAKGHAAIITVFDNNKPGWLAAVSGSTVFTENFSAAPPFVDATTVVSTAGSVSGGLWSDRVVNGGASTTWTFDEPIIGWGGNWDNTPGGPGQGEEFLLTFPGGSTQLVPAEVSANNSGQFFGFVSSVPFISVKVDGGTQGGVAETHNFDDMVLADPAATVPEPSSLALLGLGGVALAGWRRWKGKRLHTAPAA